MSGVFALELYRRVAARDAANVFLSPSSIHTALAMLAAGATGTTAEELARVLHGREAEPATALLIANALWIAHDVDVHRAYVTLVREKFRAEVDQLDFAHDTEAARQRINDWVAHATRGRIPQLIAAGQLSADALLVLTNAVYLKAAWQSPFNERATGDEPFHAPHGDVTVPMMRSIDDARFLHAGGVSVLELPYAEDGLTMLVVLPDARDGLAAIEQSLSIEQLDSWDAQLRTVEVDLMLPRFTIETSYEIGAELRAMGVQRAFSNDGEFGGITAMPLTISMILHKARVEVNEEGTEAAAATAIAVRAGAGMPLKITETFRADHPFLFLIRRRRSLLFMGRMMTP